MKLWTVSSEYWATGEGRTLSACITYADNSDEAIKAFEKSVPNGDFYSCAAIASEGVIRNFVTQYLFGEHTLGFAEKNEGKAHICAVAQLHFNAS